MRNLALGFTSLRPASLPENVCDAREDEYLICLKQLKRVLPKSFDLLFVRILLMTLNKLKM